MGLIKDFLDALKDQRKEELLLPDALTFPAIDAKQLEIKLSLEERAVEHGLQNYPKSDATVFGAFETELIDEVTRTVRPLQISYSEAMTAYASRMAALDPLGFDAGLRAKAAVLRAQIGMTVNQVKGEIFLHANNLRQREKEYKDFKEKEGNPADPHLTFSRSTKLYILIALILFEAVINGLYIGPYLAAGLLEGVGIAIAFPLITLVLFGWLGGVSLRKFHNKDISSKIIGLSLTLTSLLGATIINLFLAAIRTSVEVSDDGISEAKIIWFEYLSLNFQNINGQGLLLLLLATGFFIVALYDIYSLDHYIPGFYKAYKLRESAHAEYSEKLNDLNNRLLKEGSSIREIADSYQNLQSWQVEFNNILNNQNQLTRKYKSYLNSVEETVNRVIKKYMELNEKSRSTPIPKYFDAKWQFNEYLAWILDDADVTNDFQNKLIIVYKNIESIQKEISLEIDETRNILQPIDKVLYGS
jgi:hypothetical protein